MHDADVLKDFKWAQLGASEETLAQVEDQLQTRFPADYRALMLESDGGHGLVGDHGYVELWPVGELVEQNEGYQATRWYPGYVLIGTNGGGEAIAVREGREGSEYVLMPFIGGTEHALVGGSTLAEFLRSYGAGEIP